jgi:hypothetical protein
MNMIKVMIGILGLVILKISIQGLFEGKFILANVLPNISYTFGNIGLIILGFILVAAGFKGFNDENKKTEK